MRTRTLAALLTGAVLSWTVPAAACGFCIEDRVAAVYDQAMVERALASERSVVFFAIEGPEALDEATRRSIVLALENAGAVRGTVKVSLDNPACSLAYDPKRTSVAKVAAAAGRALAKRGISLQALRIIDEGGRLREPA